MNEPLETFTLNGYTVEIHPDHDAENPRTRCSSTLCTRHRRRTFGGETLPASPSAIEEAFSRYLADKGLNRRDIIHIPVFMYDHSGIALSSRSFNDRWDSVVLGFLYETRADIRREFKVKRISPKLEKTIRFRLFGEIEELSAWANGETYYFTIPALDDLGIGGFYGSDHAASGLLSAARAEISHAIRQKRQAHFTRLKRLIRAGVPLQYRPALAL